MKRCVYVIGLIAVVLILAACEMTPPPTPTPAPSAPAVPSAPTPGTTIVEVDRNIGDMSTVSTIVIDRGLSETAQECIDCHKGISPGITGIARKHHGSRSTENTGLAV